MSQKEVEIPLNLKEVELEYVYVTIPAEYICVYHRILVMLADYGEEMLKDCKAACKDRNSSVIDCFNMFNAAVAARKLGDTKKAELLIKYVKTKINQIYKNKDNSTSFVFPVDENGELKAYVSCGERPKFMINPEDGELYEHKFNNGFDEHFKLGPEDDSPFGQSTDDVVPGKEAEPVLQVTLLPGYEKYEEGYRACADVYATYRGKPVDLKDTSITYYFDGYHVLKFADVVDISVGVHRFTIVVKYKDETEVVSKDLYYEIKTR